MTSEDPVSLYHQRATIDNKIRNAQHHTDIENNRQER